MTQKIESLLEEFVKVKKITDVKERKLQLYFRLPDGNLQSFYKNVVWIINRPIIKALVKSEFYRGVTHQSIIVSLGLRHIRVSYLVLGSHTLEYHTSPCIFQY